LGFVTDKFCYRAEGQDEHLPKFDHLDLDGFRVLLRFGPKKFENCAMLRGVKNDTIVVSVPSSSTNLGKLLRRVEDKRCSLVIKERGTAKAVLVSIRDYVRLAAPEPDVLRVIGQESQCKGTDKLTSRQIDQVIKAARTRKPKRG
jgi:prevent-host-death family protein